MNELLRTESKRLARSWMQYDAAWLGEYLVASVEDPRLNVQSILSRHFLLRAATGNAFPELKELEYRFAAAMNWLVPQVERFVEPEELELLASALRQRADNAEGISIPAYLLRIFASLPAAAGPLTVPNYIETLLAGTRFVEGKARLHQPSLEIFQRLWHSSLQALPVRSPPVSVIEPACGSANDYRFLARYGLARLLEYTGFDLCVKNVENARRLFPEVRFELGNVFEIAAPEKSFDFCLVHDLFEHLSPAGLEVAVAEVCRVTRHGLCVGFFQAEEMPDHVIRPVQDYYWNLLSVARVKELFGAHGFEAQVLHIGRFLREHLGCEQTHNPNAYTFFLRPI